MNKPDPPLPSSLPDFTPENLHQEPLPRAETIPSTWYTSDTFLEFEQQVLFPDFWQLGVHDSQLPEQGDMFTTEIGREPILMVRDGEGAMRTFYNVCRHRGGPVAVKKGTTSVLQCRYHGWTYLLDGSLRGVPQFNKVDLFDKKDFGLKPVETDSWQGLHFVKLNENKRQLGDLLEGITERIAPIDLTGYRHHSTVTYTIDCNWKVYVDNFLEGYHIPIVHPELSRLLDYREYVTETADWHSLQYSPFREGINLYGEENGKAFYYFLFPNMMLNILPNRLQTNIIRPITAGKTEVVFHYYYTDLESERMKQVIADDLAYSDTLQQEDIEICELVQRGLRSRAYHKGRFSVDREEGVYHFQSLLKEVFRRHSGY